MSRIPQTFIDDLLNRIDIVDVVDHRVKLKKSGKNYSACCPFHEEKTPSFTVSPDKQFYYCFGCGATGNAIGFLMEYERQGFIDAVESLAKTAGLEVPKETSQQDKQYVARQKNLYDILTKADAWYRQTLREHPSRTQAVKYLRGRGLTGAIARDFGLGYAPPGWDNLLVKLGANEEDRKLLTDSGLVIRKEEEDGKLYDRFRNRIMFPIRDTRGRIIGFGGRVLGNDKPKYLNSPETDVFHKGRELYGLYEARQFNRQLDNLIVVEGYMDVIALAQFGISNAVATLGTACGEEHLQLAFRYVSEVVFCFDGDHAGRTAAKRALVNSLSSMQDGRQVKFLFLPEGQDPDTLVRQIGPDRFKAQIKSAVPLEEFLFDVAAEGIDVHSMEGRARFSKIAAPLLNELPQGVFRELMFTNLAKRTGLDRNTLMELTQEKIALVSEPAPATEAARIHPPQANDVPADHGEVPPDFLLAENTRIPAKKPSAIHLNPVRTATILLLDNLELAGKISVKPERIESDDAELNRLYALIDYLQRRPNSSFHGIIGYWGGIYGVESQQDLAALVANQFMGTAKTINSYDPLKELESAINKINQRIIANKRREELSKLQAIGLQNLNEEQKNRFRELVSLQ